MGYSRGEYGREDMSDNAIYGFCGFLKGIHGEDCGPYPFEDKEETIAWGRSQGWRGIMNKVENIL